MNMDSIAELQKIIGQFVAERNWEQYHNPKNLAMSIGIEAAEIMEHFQWLTIDDSISRLSNPEFKAEVSDEIADVMIYLLSFANATGIDIGKAVVDKMSRNQFRFPSDHKLDQ